MDLRPLLSLISSDPALAEALAEGGGQRDISMPRGAVPPALALLASGETGGGAKAGAKGHAKGHVLHVAVTATGRGAEELQGALRAYLPRDSVELFPSWETLPHERLSPRSDTVAQRLLVQRRLAHPEEFPPLAVLVMPVRALLQPITEGLGELRPVRLRVGDFVDVEELEKGLVGASYSRVDMVERRGEFAVRGGIIDIFPPTQAHPLRVDLFGDEVDEIRTFSVADQRSMKPVDEVYAPPCREILLTDDVRQRARNLMATLPGATDMLAQISEGIAPEGMESLAPALVSKMIPVIDTLPKNARITLVEPERVDQRADSLIATTEEFLAAAWSAAAAGGKVPINVDAASFTSLAETREQARKRGQAWWSLGGFARDATLADFSAANAATEAPAANTPSDFAASMNAKEPIRYLGKVEDALRDIKLHARKSWRLVLAVEGPGLGRRLRDQLEEADVAALYVDDLPEHLEPAVCYVTAAPIASGFLMESQSLGVYAAADISWAAAVPPPATCARCPPAARRAWTRCPSSRAISSCTSSTAWVAS